jgi:hypothetical protein
MFKPNVACVATHPRYLGVAAKGCSITVVRFSLHLDAA